MEEIIVPLPMVLRKIEGIMHVTPLGKKLSTDILKNLMN